MEKLLEKAKKDEIKFVDLEFTDVLGNLQVLTYTANELEGILKDGMYFDGSSIRGFTCIEESDLLLKADPATYALSPFSPDELKSARLTCDVVNPDGTPYDCDPRSALKRVVQDAGVEFIIGYEPEFFFQIEKDGKLVAHDEAAYFAGYSADKGFNIRKTILLAANDAGIPMNKGHHEVAGGQHELGFLSGDVVRLSDNFVAYRELVKIFADEEGLVATFSPKPIKEVNGSGNHTHFSIKEGDSYPFYDKDDEWGLSNMAKQFISGLMYHAPALTAALNPTVGSYERLEPGYEAPVLICAGKTNRSALVRVPAFTSAKGARAELRSPDASLNPYIGYACMLSAGLDGIDKEMDMKYVVTGNAYNDDVRKDHDLKSLPGKLEEALDAFEKNDVMKKALGSALHASYIAETKKRIEA